MPIRAVWCKGRQRARPSPKGQAPHLPGALLHTSAYPGRKLAPSKEASTSESNWGSAHAAPCHWLANRGIFPSGLCYGPGSRCRCWVSASCLAEGGEDRPTPLAERTPRLQLGDYNSAAFLWILRPFVCSASTPSSLHAYFGLNGVLFLNGTAPRETRSASLTLSETPSSSAAAGSLRPLRPGRQSLQRACTGMGCSRQKD